MAEPVVVEVRSDTSQAHREVESFFGSLRGKLTPTIDVVNALGVAWNVASAAIRAATDQVVAGVREALQAEAASRRLATAVGLHGERARAIVPELEAYNDRLEKHTLISAETIAGIQAQAAALGVLPSQLKDVTRATLGWSELMGKDVHAALQDVLGVIGGKLPEQLVKLHPEIKRAGEAFEFMAGGMSLASDRVNSTEGKLELLRIRFHDLREEIGKAITETRAFALLLEASEEGGLRNVLGRMLFGESPEDRTRSVVRRPFGGGLEERPQDLLLERGGDPTAAQAADAAQRARTSHRTARLSHEREMDSAVREFREQQRLEFELDVAAETEFLAKRRELLESDAAERERLAEMRGQHDARQREAAEWRHMQRVAELDSMAEFAAGVRDHLSTVAHDSESMNAMIHGNLVGVVEGLGQALGGGLAAALETLVMGGKGLASSLADIAAGIFSTLGAQLLSMAGVLGVLGIFNPALLPMAGAMAAAGAAATVAGAAIRKAASGGDASASPAPRVSAPAPRGFTSLAQPGPSVSQVAPGGINISVVFGYGAVVTDSRRQLGRVIQEILDDYASLSPRGA